MQTEESASVALGGKRAGGLRVALAVVVVSAAFWNLASLLSVLFTGVVHPVHYELVGLPGTPVAVVHVAMLLVSGVVFALTAMIARWRVGRTGKRMGKADWVRIGLAWWPAALSCVWVVRWTADEPRAGFLILLGSILLIARGAASCYLTVSELVGDDDAVNATNAAEPARWWREPLFWVLVVVALLLTAFHTYVQIKMHRALQYGSPDVGYYAEMLLNVLRGRGLYCEAFGHHFFGEHFSPGLYLLAPIYACYPHVETLMFVGAAAVMSAAWAVYALMRAKGGSSWLSFFMALAFLLFPACSRVIYGGSYGFHEILLSIPLMLWSFYFYQRRRWFWMSVFIVLAISLKENVAIVYGVFGFYVFLRNRRDWWGLILWAACVVHFLLVLYWIVPAYSASGAYSKFYLYGALGATPGGMVKALILDPGLFVERLWCWRTLCFALALMVPLGLLAFRRPVLIVAAPTFLFICLMNTPDFASIRFWHQASILPVIWLAVAEIVTHGGHRRRRQALGVCIFLCCLLTHYGVGFSPLSRLWRITPLTATDQVDIDAMLARLHQMIPESQTVQATARLAAHFVRQDRVYPTHREPETPADWVLLDLHESFTGEESLERIQTMVAALRMQGDYTYVGQLRSVHVFARNR